MFKCLAFLSAAIVHASVIGIDFGTEFFKVSLISPGKSFVIIENTTTKRKTENAVIMIIKHIRWHSITMRDCMRVMEHPRRLRVPKIHSYISINSLAPCRLMSQSSKYPNHSMRTSSSVLMNAEIHSYSLWLISNLMARNPSHLMLNSWLEWYSSIYSD